MGKVAYYNYRETLNRIEYFMKRTRIRFYCEDKCKGNCCGGCYDRDTSCRYHEGRRLACSFYLCTHLMDIIFPDAGDRAKYESVSNEIRRQLIKARESAVAGDRYANPYYIPYTKEQMDNFHIRKFVFDQNMPTQVNISRIANIMTNISILVSKAMGKSAQNCQDK